MYVCPSKSQQSIFNFFLLFICDFCSNWQSHYSYICIKLYVMIIIHDHNNVSDYRVTYRVHINYLPLIINSHIHNHAYIAYYVGRYLSQRRLDVTLNLVMGACIAKIIHCKLHRHTNYRHLLQYALLIALIYINVNLTMPTL